MNDHFARLFVVITKLLTAEKMRLDRFCQHGEYLAYSIKISPLENVTPTEEDIDYVLSCEIENTTYSFTNTSTDEEFSRFEEHLSKYLNVLFERKQEFENNQKTFNVVAEKLYEILTDEERQCLATHIDANTSNVLRVLGVASNK